LRLGDGLVASHGVVVVVVTKVMSFSIINYFRQATMNKNNTQKNRHFRHSLHNLEKVITTGNLFDSLFINAVTFVTSVRSTCHHKFYQPTPFGFHWPHVV
jgi:hypothetical protein